MRSPPNSRRAAAPIRHVVRIIGGRWKRTPLPVADQPGLRPTPNRIRETLFNWLGQDLSGWRCLDAFAGTGALGLEAASRGAASAVLVERDARLAAGLRQLSERLGASQVQIHCRDALTELRACAADSVDLIFLDPPFDSQMFEPALAAAARAVAPRGLIYLEAPDAWDAARLAPYGLAVRRHLKAGTVHAHLLYRPA